jgi:acyl carrier protein
MLTQTNIQTTVSEEIESLLLEDQSEVDALTGHEQLHDLGLNSLMFARLIIQLEAMLGVDPFAEEGVMIWDVRSVDDLVALYERASVMAEASTPADGRSG